MNSVQFFFPSNKFYGVLSFDNYFPKKQRRRVLFILLLPVFLLSILSAFAFFVTAIGPALNQSTVVNIFFTKYIMRLLVGLLCIVLAPFLAVGALDSFANSKTYDKRGKLESANFAERLNFFAAELVFHGSGIFRGATPRSLLEAFATLDTGGQTLMRLGVSFEEYASLLQGLGETGSIESALAKFSAVVPSGDDATLTDLVSVLIKETAAIHNYFGQRGLSDSMIQHALEWVETTAWKEDMHRRWWTRERLGKIPGFAKNWAYGHVPLLAQYSSDLSTEAARAAGDLVGRDREVQLLESALLKQAGGNAIIIGEPGSGRHTILYGLVRMIEQGTIFPELEHKRILILYAPSIISAGKTKGDTEELLINVLNEAVRAGNIILVIDEFPEFVKSLGALGISMVEVFAPYLTSAAIHIIGIADPVSFKKILENDAGLLKFFERVDIKEPDANQIVEILEDLAPDAERKFGNQAYLTFPSLQKIAEGALQYLVVGALPKRAVDLMEEAVQEAVAGRSALVTPEMVTSIITRKTKMPLGQIGAGEKGKLLDLERLLQERVIGQKEATAAVADAVRRARAGIRNPSRPIGSFLLLGPTGVGKTETAKTLAAIYFGSEDAMLRFDMTEYQSDESVERLIGSFDKDEPGILASKILASPYAVVLLDEFEKTNLKVKNLFLQILDEGFFSDYAGRKVNMRNTIIVATSNSGSLIIGDLVAQKTPEDELKQKIITYTQQEKIMSPELLNRFDSIIVYHPLEKETLLKIARIMLGKLTKRLAEQNIKLNITDDLVTTVAEGGYNPTWGARPMQRFIQDHVEKCIAEKIIKGEVKPGSEFSLSGTEIA